MKYNLIPSGNTSKKDSIFIYILPSGFEKSSYLIAYPDFAPEDILAGRISIRTFEGCSTEAFEEIKVELKGRLRKKYEKYLENINTLFTLGLGFFILGIIDWVIPDPVLFIDELVLMIFGGFTAWKSWRGKKEKLPMLKNKIDHYNYNSMYPKIGTDTILTSIFKAIRCKIDPIGAVEIVDGMDEIEIESLWMTRYLNIQDLSAAADISGIKELLRVIKKVFLLRRLLKLEGKKQNKWIRSQFLNLEQQTESNTGILPEVLAVYLEFYKLSLTYHL
jgi:hypothetical protein